MNATMTATRCPSWCVKSHAVNDEVDCHFSDDLAFENIPSSGIRDEFRMGLQANPDGSDVAIDLGGVEVTIETARAIVVALGGLVEQAS